jgi:hypothetical protein
VSLLLCLTACTLWVRSYFRWDDVERSHLWPHGSEWRYLECRAQMRDGGVRLSFDSYHFDAVAREFQHTADEWFVKTIQPGDGASRNGELRRFTYTRFPYRRPKTLGANKAVSFTILSFPVWSLALPLGIGALPLILFVRRRLRPVPGLCANRGYDLRASPDR